MIDLSPDNDPIKVAEPVNIAPTIWKISKLNDVKTTLLNPQVSITDLLSKDILRRIQDCDDSIEKTMLLYEAIGRGNRVQSDQSRLAHISISKSLSNALNPAFINEFVFHALDENKESIEVMSEIIWPIINQWRCIVLKTSQNKCLKLDEKIWDFFLASEKANLRQLSKIEHISREIYELAALIKFPLIDGQRIKIEDWVNPAFLALRPLAYTSSLMFRHLSENREILRELQSSKHLRICYIQEVERMMNSFRYIFRQVTKGDIIIGKKRIPNGSNLLLDLVAANRDPSRWDNPTNLNLGRKYIKPASFGYGMLCCTGNNITNRFLHVVLDAFLISCSQINPSGEGYPLNYVYNNSSSLRGMQRLYLNFTI